MWKRKKQIADERIEKESSRIYAKLYYLMSALTVLAIAIKIYYKLPLYMYLLELLSLLVSGVFVIASEVRYGILFLKDKDEVVLAIHNKILAKAMMTSFWIFIVGEFLFTFVVKEYIQWVGVYFVIWGVPALISMFFAIRNGWLIWGSKKKEKTGKKELKGRTAVGALFYGVIMGIPMVFQDDGFHAEGLLWMLGMAVAWGVLFYLMFVGFMKLAEKRADKIVGKKEIENEK